MKYSFMRVNTKAGTQEHGEHHASRATKPYIIMLFPPYGAQKIGSTTFLMIVLVKSLPILARETKLTWSQDILESAVQFHPNVQQKSCKILKSLL